MKIIFKIFFNSQKWGGEVLLNKLDEAKCLKIN